MCSSLVEVLTPVVLGSVVLCTVACCDARASPRGRSGTEGGFVRVFVVFVMVSLIVVL